MEFGRMAQTCRILSIEVGRRGNSPTHRCQFEHRQIEAAPVEGHEAAAKILHEHPEFADESILGIVRNSKSLDVLQSMIISHIADRYRNRDMQSNRKKIATAGC